MPDDKKQGDFTFDTVAVLCASVLMGGGSIGNKSYEMMSALDGKRTANGFQHQFRAVLKRARELKEQMEGAEGIKGVEAKSRAPKTPKTPKSDKGKRSGKRGRDSNKVKNSPNEDSAEAGGEQDTKRRKYELDFPDVKEEVKEEVEEAE